MWIRVVSVAVMLAFTAVSAIAETAEGYIKALTALGEPRFSTCRNSMLLLHESGSDPRIGEIINEVKSAPYLTIPFDVAAATRIGEMVRAAAAASGDTDVSAIFEDMAEGSVLLEEVSGGFAQLSGDPGSLLDIAAIYLILTWAVLEDDPVQSDPDRMRITVEAVRNQLALSEGQCLYFWGLKDEITASRDRMMVRSGFLIEGMEGLGDDEAEKFRAYIRETSGREIEGLTLTDSGFQER